MRHGNAGAGAPPPPPPPAGAALFSVPPASPPASGVYAAPAEAFLMRNLDSGQSFLLDQRYWIKDVDTGRVFVLHPEEGSAGGAGSAGRSGAGGSGAGGAAGGSPGAGGGADGAARAAAGGGAGASGRPAGGAAGASPAAGGAGSLRVSDLLSGEALSLREFEEALGYSGGAEGGGGGGGGGGGDDDAPSLAAAAGAAARRGAAAGARAAARSGAWLRAAAGAAAARAVGREGRPPAPPDGGAPASPGSASGSSAGAQHHHAPPPADGLGLPVRVVTSKKAFKEFTDLRLVQTLPAHRGVIWAARFSRGGRHLATAGQDGVVRVWAVARSRGLNIGGLDDGGASTSAPASDAGAAGDADEAGVGGGAVHAAPLLSRRPERAYSGHRADVLALAWSRTDFLLSASMDKTVRLWHATMPDCLRVFKHTDFVTAIDFHPADDKHFLSGSIDGKVRLWNVPEQRVAAWQDVHDMVTAVAHGGRRAVVGTMRGRCRFYGAAARGALEYEAQLDVKNRRGRDARGKKVTGVALAPPGAGPPGAPPRLLVTSNDSRIRLYEGYALVAKYKGHANRGTQIAAAFSPRGEFVVCGSDDGWVYIWATRRGAAPGGSGGGASSGPGAGSGAASGAGGAGGAAGLERPSAAGLERASLGAGGSGDAADGAAAAPAREKSASYEAFQAGGDVVTVALFAPESARRAAGAPAEAPARASAAPGGGGGAAAAAAAADAAAAFAAGAARGQVVVTAGYGGELRVYENVGLPQWL